ncbi:MAG: hypothetical protein GX847_01200 [Clostridiales bacterium]|nr:hypothetical protein [Clostridiales bacterium]
MSERCGHDSNRDCHHGHGHQGHGHDHYNHSHEHHREAEELVEFALKKSVRRALYFDTPVSAKAVALEKLSALSEIAELIAFEGVILGHIKALLDFGERKVSISITRLDECRQSFDGWDDFEAESCILTVNILSLHNAGAVLDEYMEKLLSN